MSKSSIDLSKVYHVNAFKNVDTLNEIIENLNIAIDGRFNEISDPDVSTDIDIAMISPTGVDFYDQDGEQIISTVSLEEFKEITIIWRDHIVKKNFFKQFWPFNK